MIIPISDSIKYLEKCIVSFINSSVISVDYFFMRTLQLFVISDALMVLRFLINLNSIATSSYHSSILCFNATIY